MGRADAGQGVLRARPDSYEHVAHARDCRALLVDLRTGVTALARPRARDCCTRCGNASIGVIYQLKETELHSHYMHASAAAPVRRMALAGYDLRGSLPLAAPAVRAAPATCPIPIRVPSAWADAGPASSLPGRCSFFRGGAAAAPHPCWVNAALRRQSRGCRVQKRACGLAK
ncbi:erythromycin esterase family protein [Cupriavidus basilensis]